MEVLTFIDNNRIERDIQTDDFRIIGKLAHTHYFKMWDYVRKNYSNKTTEQQSEIVHNLLMNDEYKEDVLKFEVI
jgi:hypothetical protein